MNREYSWDFYFLFVILFSLLFDKFRCAFYLGLKSVRCVNQKLVLRFVDDESDLHRGSVMLDYIILLLLWDGNNLVGFLKNLL